MDKIISLLKYIGNVGKASLFRPFRKMFMELRRKLMLKTALGKIVRKSMNKVGIYLAGKPDSLKHYFGFRRYLIAKKLVVVFLLILIGTPIVYFKWLKPYLMGKLWTPTFVINHDQYETYKGRAKLVTKGKYLIYEGEVEEGRSTGKGSLYDYEGNLVYTGQFVLDEYSGLGELYYKNGTVKYKGQFSSNTYNGEGILYGETGEVIYTGNFVDGKYSGTGTLYSDSGRILYEGEFALGNYQGTGTLYDENGNLFYKGQFENGLKNGTGVLYNALGKIVYQGEFVKDLYGGQGELYRPNGSREYVGEFSKSLYHGEGTLFTEQDKKKYKGTFRQGKKEGQGTLFSDDEKEIFTGTIKNDEIDYLSYLGEPAEEINKAFLAENELIMGEEEFYTYYKDFETFFTFSYAKEEVPPKLKTMIYTGDSNPLKIEHTISLEKLEVDFGKPIKQRYKSITEKEFYVLSKIKKYPEQLYIRCFNYKDYVITLYYRDKMDTSYLFCEVGRELNENVEKNAQEYINEYNNSNIDSSALSESNID